MRLVNHASALVHEVYQREKVDDVMQWRDAVKFPTSRTITHSEAETFVATLPDVLTMQFNKLMNSGTTNGSSKNMQVGIDSFATAFTNDAAGLANNTSDALRLLIDRIVQAEQVGLDVFGIGEHHRREFLDSAPPVILAGAAARTTHPAYQCRDGVERSRSGSRVPTIRHAGFAFARPGGDGRRTRLVHRVFPVVWFATRRLRFVVCREA